MRSLPQQVPSLFKDLHDHSNMHRTAIRQQTSAHLAQRLLRCRALQGLLFLALHSPQLRRAPQRWPELGGSKRAG